MFNVVKGESIAVCEGDHFSMILPDGSSFNCEQTADDFSIVAMDGKVILSRATSKTAKADDLRTIDGLCDEACPQCGNREKATLSMSENCVHCVKCGGGYDLPDVRDVNAVERLRRAVELLLTDFRTLGCPDKSCIVCQKSKAAEDFARAALEKTSPAVTWSYKELIRLSNKELFGLYMMMCLDAMPAGGEDPADYGVVYDYFESTPKTQICKELAQMRIVK